jgi:hypothetical protein
LLSRKEPPRRVRCSRRVDRSERRSERREEMERSNLLRSATSDPFPDITEEVVDAKGVWIKAFGRSCACRDREKEREREITHQRR